MRPSRSQVLAVAGFGLVGSTLLYFWVSESNSLRSGFRPTRELTQRAAGEDQQQAPRFKGPLLSRLSASATQAVADEVLRHLNLQASSRLVKLSTAARHSALAALREAAHAERADLAVDPESYLLLAARGKTPFRGHEIC